MEPSDPAASTTDADAPATRAETTRTTHTETIHACGHEHVSADHASTFEITSDDWLTPAGDCILAVEADRVPSEFDAAFVAAAQDAAARITVRIDAGGQSATITGRGHPDLTFAGDRSTVGRTSDYVDDRTIMVGADAAAGDLGADLVAALAEGREVTVTLRVEPEGSSER
jgi:hypothetical protein